MKKIPEKTIERLSQYRRVLFEYHHEHRQFIYSHQLAGLLHITPVQVRRDLMLIGYSGSLRRGYHVGELIDKIAEIIDSPEVQKVCVVGLGNLGRAIIRYFRNKRDKLQIVASFDIDPVKYECVTAGVNCFPMEKLKEIIRKENITVAVLTVPRDQAEKTAQMLVDAGIRGILNYTSSPLNFGPGVFVEDYDFITSLEKASFFARNEN